MSWLLQVEGKVSILVKTEIIDLRDITSALEAFFPCIMVRAAAQVIDINGFCEW